MENVIRVQMMGSFSIFVNGECVDGMIRRSRKSAALVQFLILNAGIPVPNRRLFDVLWPEESSSNPESALKTLVSRVRGLLRRVSPEMVGCIVAESGGYRWECLPGVSVDLYEVEEILGRLESGAEPGARKELFEKLMRLYRGDLLQSGDQSEWSLSRSTALHNRFVSAALEYVELLKGEKDYDQIEAVCRQALETDNFDERFHMALMSAQIRTGQMDDALAHYLRVRRLYYRHLGVQPSEDLQAFYRKILRTGRVQQLDLNTVRSELLKKDGAKEPMVCDYSMFREMYSLMVFNQEKNGFPVLLAAVLLDDAGDVPVDAARLDDAMLMLLEILRAEFGWGDVITRFGPAMYVLLLPGAEMQKAGMKLERIRQRFLQRYSHGNITFSHQIGPLKVQ